MGIRWTLRLFLRMLANLRGQFLCAREAGDNLQCVALGANACARLKSSSRVGAEHGIGKTGTSGPALIGKTMGTTRETALKSLVLPGAVLLLVAAVLAHSGWLILPVPSLTFLYYCSAAGGMLLAWRFHSSRIFFALVVLFLALLAVEFFGAHAPAQIFESTGLRIAAILVPIDFVLIALMHERGFSLPTIAPVVMFFFTQAVVVTVFCQAAGLPTAHARSHHAPAAISFPSYLVMVFVAAGVFLLVRAFVTRKPVDGALLWSLAAFFLALKFTSVPRIATLYSVCGACILAVSIIENSYLLAYHDELTTLASRRAFNDALLRLQHPYSIAMVDIDHFKRFNDTYGHDTGDQVLRLVAGKLSRVSGGGDVFRCGGEEFAILFPGKKIAEVKEHLEQLRATIESSEFRTRGADRRQQPRGPDRRDDRPRGRARKGDAIRQLAQHKPAASSSLSVTISIGAAMSAAPETRPEDIIEAADKALYRAKANGRNRVEFAASPRQSNRAKAAGIA
jgi:GGDEF domain-containing protein